MRNALHITISVLMWCLFGWYWYVVGQRKLNPETLDAVVVLGTVVTVGVVLTLLWVAHNLRLSRKFGRRKGFKGPPETFTHDHLQRPLIAPPLEELRRAKIVTIALDADGHKVYAPGGEVSS